jgi:hypothetical protein
VIRAALQVQAGEEISADLAEDERAMALSLGKALAEVEPAPAPMYREVQPGEGPIGWASQRTETAREPGEDLDLIPGATLAGTLWTPLRVAWALELPDDEKARVRWVNEHGSEVVAWWTGRDLRMWLSPALRPPDEDRKPPDGEEPDTPL